MYGPAGPQVGGDVTVRGAVLVAPISASDTGTYVVLWQVFAADVFCHTDTDKCVIMIRLGREIAIIADENFHSRV